MENNSQAIEIKGIVRNQTKIGVQDGQCDDIVNLRFKDGSWRVADDGKEVYSMPDSVMYKDIHVHTCGTYRHVLGVNPTENKLYWFANIADDGETFETLDTPVEICDVQGDVTIVANGHLMTIVSVEMTYSIFLEDEKKYKILAMSPNGNKTSRDLFPLAEVHFNLHQDESATLHKFAETAIDMTTDGGNPFDGAFDKNQGKVNAEFTIEYCRDVAKTMFGEQTQNNKFTRPFLACAAIKLYDGSFVYATPPVLLNPNEMANSMSNMYGQKYLGKFQFAPSKDDDVEVSTYYDWMWFENQISQVSASNFYNNDFVCVPSAKNTLINNETKKKVHYTSFVASNINSANTSGESVVYKAKNPPIFCAGAHIDDSMTGNVYPSFQLLGYDLAISIRELSILSQHPDIFKSICVFVTNQADVYGFDKGDSMGEKWISAFNFYEYYKPKKREDADIIYDLLHSPLFLLKEYNISNISEITSNPIIDLSKPEDKGILSALSSQEQLPSEALDRKENNPRVAYLYNQKLHIANYQSEQFHGYPIDLFHLNNYLVIPKKGGYLFDVLPNIEISEDDQYNQYQRSKYTFLSNCSDETYDQYIQVSKDKGYCFASIRVLVETQQGDQQVVRYIQPYEAYKFTKGDNANFVESLGALITFPDNRAKEMEVAVISLHEGRVYRRSKTFKLTPHPYLNIAYYIEPQLKPIYLPIVGFSTGVSLDDFITNSQIGLFVTPNEWNNTEYYPNGLKVSEVNNPFIFPYENTYQVGNVEIISLMSNAVAVGTGQTGSAPLYVFCKDGIYALMVDISGGMVYKNARIIARDVCNNAKSVTPIDNGVVFTTDRGIMNISGNEVVEIGSAAEGDVFDITDISDKAKKIMFNAFTMQQLAEFPEGLIGNTDFLTYLKGAIINYNHNERELMVSNPDKDYTYVMDRNGNWSRRAFTAQEYVNNYPTSYRIDKEGKFYKVDTDDNDTNKIYLLSNVIKLGTIAFKQAYRLIVRGYFETYSAAYGKINGVNVKVVGSFIDGMKAGEGLQMTYKTQYGQAMWVDVDNNNYVLNGQIQILDPATNEDITYSVVSVNSGQYYRVVKSYEKVGCYVFGSYDGRQWSLLGGNEKGGKFTDIGCKIAHTDIRYLRVCLAGKLSKDTRIDYIEVSADGSALNGKLR